MNDDQVTVVKFPCCWHCSRCRRECTDFDKENGHRSWCVRCFPARKTATLT